MAGRSTDEREGLMRRGEGTDRAMSSARRGAKAFSEETEEEDLGRR